MAASYDECIAAFPRSQVCLDRTYSQLLSWASYITAQPLPPTDTAPEIAFVQQRILAERVPIYANTYQNQVAPYLLEIPNITQDIRNHLNAYNDEAMEQTISGEMQSSMAVVMPKYAAATVSNQEVANWCEKNGYPIPDGLANTLGF